MPDENTSLPASPAEAAAPFAAYLVEVEARYARPNIEPLGDAAYLPDSIEWKVTIGALRRLVAFAQAPETPAVLQEVAEPFIRFLGIVDERYSRPGVVGGTLPDSAGIPGDICRQVCMGSLRRLVKLYGGALEPP